MPSMTTEAVALTLLTAVSLAVGFLAASAPAQDEDAAPLATLGPGGEAFEVSLEQGETLTLVAPEQTHPGRFALFDPDDEVIAHPSLEAGQRASFPIEQAGEWVLMRTTGPPTRLDVGILSPQDPTMERVQSIPVQEHRLSLTEQPADPLELERPLEIHRKPALIHLDLDGNAEAFQATVESQEGPVFETQARSLNETDDLLEPAATTAHPDAIEPGIYQVTAEAELLEGELFLTHRTYVRNQESLEVAQATTPGAQREGVPIAAIREGAAVHVDGDQHREIVLAAHAQTSATALVYDDQDHVRAVVGLNEAEGYDWEFSDEAAPLVETTKLHLPPGPHTVYVSNLDGEDDQLYLLAPDARTANPALEASLDETRISLDSGTVSTGEEHEVETHLPGGVVDISVDIEEAASGDRSVSVLGPLGLLFHHDEQTSAAGVSVESETISNPSHFTGGTFTVQVEEGQSVDASVHVTLTYYEPLATG